METYDLAVSTAERLADHAGPRASRSRKTGKSKKPERLMSLDAYRGLIMIVLAGTAFGLGKLSHKAVEQGCKPAQVWKQIEYHTSHPEWISQMAVPESIDRIDAGVIGCSAWDMIQPSFMFMVGVAMVFSYAKRKQQGDSRLKTFSHVLIRSAALVLLGVFLASQWGTETNWVFSNVLCQIGLGYAFVYLMLGRRFIFQAAAGVLILVGWWLAFFYYPLPGPDFDYASVGIAAESNAVAGEADDAPAPIADNWRMPDRFAPWTKNANLAADVDRWLLNQFPRSERFEFNNGGYTTLNFVPSMFTMLLGVMAGQLLRGPRRPMVKFLLLLLGGLLCVAAGAAAGATVCPVVKRIWSPSWALLSGAYALWILALFYLVIDVMRIRFWSWPLIVVGMNPILVYVMFQSMRGWVTKMLTIHVGPDLLPAAFVQWLDATYGVNLGQHGPFEPIVQAVMVLLVFWLICVWMYRQKLFVRL